MSLSGTLSVSGRRYSITTQQEFAEVREVPALEMNGVSWRVGRHTVLSDVSLALQQDARADIRQHQEDGGDDRRAARLHEIGPGRRRRGCGNLIHD